MPQALPFKFINIGGILGDSDAVTTLAMPQVLGSGSKNFYIDQYARATQVGGYAKQNVAPGVRIGGDNTKLVALHPFIKSDGTDQVLGAFDDGVDSWAIEVSTDTGVTWALLTDYAPSVGALPTFAGLGTLLAITNGVMKPQVYDGTSLRDGGSTRLAAPAITNNGVGVLNGKYQWRIVPVRSDANGGRKVGSSPSAAVTIAVQAQTVTWVADADVNVLGYEIYRTLGTDAVFFFVAYSSGRLVVTYNDNTIDSDLRGSRPLQEFGDPPPNGSFFCFEHKQRMWYARTATFPRSAWYSDVGIIDSVYTQTNTFDATDAETASDVVTGGVGEFREMAALFLEKSIWTITGTGIVQGALTDFILRRSDARIGAVHQRAIVRLPAGAKYPDETGQIQATRTETLAYFTPLGDVWIFDGYSSKMISDAKNTLLNTRNYAARTKTYGFLDYTRDELVFCFAAGNATTPDTCVVLNYKYGVWYERDWPFAHVASVQSATSPFTVLAGEGVIATGGFCYKLWTGTTRDGAAMATQLMLKGLYGRDDNNQPTLMQDCRWRQVDALIIGSVGALNFEYVAGEATNAAGAIGTDVGVVVTSGIPRFKCQSASGIYFESRGVRLRFKTSGEGIFSIAGLVVAYQLLPGLQRPFTA